jgi:hypothetical protein
MDKYLGKFTYGSRDFEMSVQNIGGGVRVELTMGGENVLSESVPLPMLAGLFLTLREQWAWELEDKLSEIRSKRKEE